MHIPVSVSHNKPILCAKREGMTREISSFSPTLLTEEVTAIRVCKHLPTRACEHFCRNVQDEAGGRQKLRQVVVEQCGCESTSPFSSMCAACFVWSCLPGAREEMNEEEKRK
jgi:hypothetical protein